MRKNGKKALSLLLALCMVLGMLPIPAFAAVDGNFTIDSTGKLTAYNGPGGDVVIPRLVMDRIVGSIAPDIFADRPDITSITFPENMYSFFSLVMMPA